MAWIPFILPFSQCDENKLSRRIPCVCIVCIPHTLHMEVNVEWNRQGTNKYLYTCIRINIMSMRVWHRMVLCIVTRPQHHSQRVDRRTRCTNEILKSGPYITNHFYLCIELGTVPNLFSNTTQPSISAPFTTRGRGSLFPNINDVWGDCDIVYNVLQISSVHEGGNVITSGQVLKCSRKANPSIDVLHLMRRTWINFTMTTLQNMSNF